ncbi:MAG: hypothetical protein AAFQ94_19850 [Bacteroidota bacterium]
MQGILYPDKGKNEIIPIEIGYIVCDQRHLYKLISIKRSILFVLLFQLVLIVKAQNKEVEVEALKLLEMYDPMGHYILSETINAPSNYNFDGQKMFLSGSKKFARYIQGKETDDIIQSLNTVVHEMTHGYSHKLTYKILKEMGEQPDFKTQYLAIPISEEESILITQTETFSSKKLAEVIPDALKTFRFKTYIKSKNPILSTQQSGIYGLLNEFSAYYHGTRASYNTFQYYTGKAEITNQDYLDYLSDVNSTRNAYLEFKYYILQYLIYAKKHNRTVYNGVIANERFKDAFRKIDALFSQLQKDYSDRRKEISDLLTEKGIRVHYDDDVDWIGTSGVGSFQDEYNALKTELEKQIYINLLNDLGSQSGN